MAGNFLAAALASFILTVIACPLFIKRMKVLQYGQQIREDGPGSHTGKAGTPTMGGVVFISAAIAVSIFASEISIILFTAIIAILGCGLIGFFDDYLKVARSNSLGLKARAKLAAVILIALILLLMLQLSGLYSSELTIPFSHTSIDLGWLYPLFVLLVIAAATNSVNLTDGLDGLAAGSSAIALAAYSYISYRSGLTELAVMSAAFSAACIGFLIYNRNPARLFMGDTGSFALGGVFAVLAVITKTELLLIIIGAVFVIEALSVIIQVLSYQVLGKRILLMSPLHHHFELKGWTEWRVVTVFWGGSLIFAIIGLVAHSP